MIRGAIVIVFICYSLDYTHSLPDIIRIGKKRIMEKAKEMIGGVRVVNDVGGSG